MKCDHIVEVFPERHGPKVHPSADDRIYLLLMEGTMKKLLEWIGKVTGKRTCYTCAYLKYTYTMECTHPDRLSEIFGDKPVCEAWKKTTKGDENLW